MFGFVMADPRELTQEELLRYRSHYCGICRAIGKSCGEVCRLALNYDTTFLSLLLTSLYEPEEETRKIFCALHPVGGRFAAENELINYAAAMNVALACFSCRDHWLDEKNLLGYAGNKVLSHHLPEIQARFPRQYAAIRDCVAELACLEAEKCPNPDEAANCFGKLMAELFVYKEDLWAPCLRDMGMALGRFIYLADAIVDFEKDQKQGSYNPLTFLSPQPGPARWKQYLVLELSACTDQFERLPLVQDKSLLDKILYSGIWLAYGKKMGKKREETEHDRSL